MEELTSCCTWYNCQACDYRADGRCAGCRSGNLELREQTGAACAVFECVETRKIDSCRECPETSCRLSRVVETICPLRGHFEKQRWWAGRMSRALEFRRRHAAGRRQDEKMSERVVKRLRWYLVALDSFEAEGHTSVSSWQLAERVGVSSALIRKDLSRFGEFGTPSYGYRTTFLQERIKNILGLDKPRSIVWVGACALRHHVSDIERLGRNNCRLVGVFDVDDNEIGGKIGDFTVEPVERMAEALAGTEVSAAVISVPAARAQQIANTLVDLGARAILNLSAQLLVLPDDVRVCSLDIAGELMELCYYC